jgi:hypothetical protein
VGENPKLLPLNVAFYPVVKAFFEIPPRKKKNCVEEQQRV